MRRRCAANGVKGSKERQFHQGEFDMQAGIRGETVAGLALGRDTQGVVEPLHAAASALLLVARPQRIREVQQGLQAACAAHQEVPQVRAQRRHEMLRVEALGQDLVKGEQRRGIVPGQESIHQAETVFIVQHTQIADHVRIVDVRPAEGDRLVEEREGVAHGPVRLVGDHVQGLVIHRDPLLAGDAAQVAHDVRHADAVEIVGLAAAQDRREDLVLLRGGEDEDGVCRRLLEGLEEGVESRLREHVHLIDDIHRIASHLRRDLHLVHQGLDVVHAVVGRRIQFVDAVGVPFGERAAGVALAARLQVRTGMGAVDGLGEDARGTGFAYSTGTAEQIGMRQLAPEDGVLEGPCDIVLSDQGLERVRTVFAG